MALRSWKVHATRLLLAAVLVVITGWVIGLAWQVPLVVLMAYLAWHLANLWRLYRWLQIPGSAVPESIGLWSDIYERIAALEKENRQQNERFRGMIADFRQLTDAFPDATLVIDRNACISWFNRAATRLLELRSPEDLGKPVTNLLRGPDFANWLAVQDQVRSPLEMASPRSDNIWLSVSAFAFQDEIGHLRAGETACLGAGVAIGATGAVERSDMLRARQQRTRDLAAERGFASDR